MEFKTIALEHWARREYFQHYHKEIPCTYSMTVKLDITRLKREERKLYPTMLFYLTQVVNRHDEFKTAFNGAGQLGIYEEMLPSYTVFHRDTETFSNLWTEYVPDLDAFVAAYERDLAEYGDRQGLIGKPGQPENSFPVSMVPWATFEGFNLNLQKGYDYLLPIFTMGRYYEAQGRTWLPLAVQVHHGVCDGFHVCRFLEELQQLLED